MTPRARLEADIRFFQSRIEQSSDRTERAYRRTQQSALIRLWRDNFTLTLVKETLE